MGFKFVGSATDDGVGASVAPAGDVDGDGRPDLLLGAYDVLGEQSTVGQVFLIDEDALPPADAADGLVDGRIDVANLAGVSGSFAFVGEESLDATGFRVMTAGDVDGDGQDDLLISAPLQDGTGTEKGAVYLVNADALSAADVADGTMDGVIQLGNLAGQTGSYKIVGDDFDALGFGLSTVGDIDNDGRDEFAIGAPAASDFGSDAGAVYIVDGLDLASADAADGTTDGVINAANVAAQTGSYRVFSDSDNLSMGTFITRLGDQDGDGLDDFMFWATVDDLGVDPFAILVSSGDLAAADAADGTADGNIDVDNLVAQPDSYRIDGTATDSLSTAIPAPGGDLTGNGTLDLVITAPLFPSGTGDNGALYVLDGSQLAVADAADGTVDGRIALTNIPAQANSFRFTGATTDDESGISASAAGDADGDGKNDLLIGNNAFAGIGDPVPTVAGYLVNADDFAAADAADGTTDGQVSLANIAGLPKSYRFDQAGGLHREDTVEFDFIGDVDGDGKDDFMIGIEKADDGTTTGAGNAWLALSGQLASYDAADGTTDGVIQLENIECFAEGTHIATPRGASAVERLGPGDTVLTSDGRAVPVLWVGKRTVMRRFAGPRADLIRIAAGTFGATCDLFLTEDHGLFVDDLIINAAALVNGTTVARVPAAALPDRYTVYHVETEAHDMILAGGVAVETYMSECGRSAFENFDEYLRLYGANRPIVENSMPRITTARLVPQALRARLSA